MSLERGPVSREILGSLRSCFVEGDPEQQRRERRARRRALAVSVAVQAAIVAGLILIPLFGQPGKIVLAYMPVPIYSRASPKAARIEPMRSHVRPQNVCRFCPPHAIPQTVVMHDSLPPTIEETGSSFTDTVPVPGGIPLSGTASVPPRVETHAEPSRVIHFTHIDPALLIHRVEPIYPPLAIQTHRSGRVELRAVIATDGSIQSLQVASGDPLFFRSALDAVRQWRYRPTVLNGQPVQIDTFITVIYNVQR